MHLGRDHFHLLSRTFVVLFLCVDVFRYTDAHCCVTLPTAHSTAPTVQCAAWEWQLPRGPWVSPGSVGASVMLTHGDLARCAVLTQALLLSDTGLWFLFIGLSDVVRRTSHSRVLP